jgi:polyphenol oxidase
MFPIAAGVVDPRSPGGRPASWAATGRSGGTSPAPYDSLNLAGYVGDDAAAVAENRRRLAGVLGLPGERLVVMDSVHGADVAVVASPGVVPGVDALLTQEPDLAIVALGADCVPIVLIGDDDRTVAVAHCGWRGLVADVLGVVVGAMADHGSGVARAILGPSVCGQCYPVPPERAAEVAGAWPGPVSRAALVTCADGQPGIDVRRGAAERLAALGVAPDAIACAGGCTVEDAGLFSYRRDGVTGRQGVAACRHGLARMGS